MGSLSCTRGNRPLRNPASVQNGMGPVCAGKASAALRDDLAGGVQQARYDIVKSTAEAVWIRDVGHMTNRSVTNDADRVVCELFSEYGLGARRLIYQDSDGNWDELKHDGARFIGFAPARNMAP